jgi:hypothetical protein
VTLTLALKGSVNLVNGLGLLGTVACRRTARIERVLGRACASVRSAVRHNSWRLNLVNLYASKCVCCSTRVGGTPVVPQWYPSGVQVVPHHPSTPLEPGVVILTTDASPRSGIYKSGAHLWIVRQRCVLTEWRCLYLSGAGCAWKEVSASVDRFIAMTETHSNTSGRGPIPGYWHAHAADFADCNQTHGHTLSVSACVHTAV